MINPNRYTPFFSDYDSPINYTVVGQKPRTTNTTFYNSKDIYDTVEQAKDRAYNIGCSGYRNVLVNAVGQYKFSPCEDVKVYKKIIKEMPKIETPRIYYDFDPTENLYDVRDSFNDNLESGFEYKDQILVRTLSNVLYRDPIRSSILAYFDKAFFGLVESTKQIRNFFNYTVKKNNKRVF